MGTQGSPVKSYDYLLKFLLVGDSDVGKGEILESLQDGASESPYAYSNGERGAGGGILGGWGFFGGLGWGFGVIWGWGGPCGVLWGWFGRVGFVPVSLQCLSSGCAPGSSGGSPKGLAEQSVPPQSTDPIAQVYGVITEPGSASRPARRAQAASPLSPQG
uniref:RAB40C, member RAS oncogene family n=2 Tax=Anas TaxID=8835 RepID=A0A493SWC2_ANAPP